jgi:AraC-like DNA-binding protein
MLDVNETVLSNTINAYYKKNFRSLINELRVKEVENRLLNEGAGNLSLLGLAMECGFNSEASFYRIFKAITGSTPKQFLTEHSSGSHF